MKKIVVISNRGPVNDDLIVLLAALFPECDISIAEADTQYFEPFPVGTFSKTDMPDEIGT
jgi:hypothetical protein